MYLILHADNRVWSLLPNLEVFNSGLLSVQTKLNFSLFAQVLRKTSPSIRSYDVLGIIRSISHDYRAIVG
jgi:hypothetical protein